MLLSILHVFLLKLWQHCWRYFHAGTDAKKIIQLQRHDSTVGNKRCTRPISRDIEQVEHVIALCMQRKEEESTMEEIIQVVRAHTAELETLCVQKL